MSRPVTLYLPDQLIVRIDEIAARENRSRSSVIATLLNKLSEGQVDEILHGGRAEVIQ